ncbi:MAG: tRNA preQ1(34) S-adenosylmethionine ribosyltransferase-isomerase QueA [Candidatus Omnitrophica bacterium]|nr:tRNA preQ1(34) S-adenosylmethionine ribosyltransferase-isomerase QueA [Candidatus Omnitrophota bacterium]
MLLKLSDFDYKLPKELIAQYPCPRREDARLLVVSRKTGKIEHRVFKEIGEFFQPDDLLVLNNTKVLPSRLFGKRATGGKVEVLLLKRKSGLIFEAWIKPARLKIGEKIIFNGDKLFCTLSNHNELTFDFPDLESVYKLGVMPLPPYIKRNSEAGDNINYQTVFAKEEGAIASPTAGLHFSQDLLAQIKASGIHIAYITLHVGIGTFKPVKSEDVTEHKIDPESFKVPQEAADLILEAQAKKHRILAVGTTVCRTLETFAAGKKEGEADLFIYPGYKFKIVDCLLTNFHLPGTTLLMLVYGFLGQDLAKEAYAKAIEKKYRFYSYGDCMLIV